MKRDHVTAGHYARKYRSLASEVALERDYRVIESYNRRHCGLFPALATEEEEATHKSLDSEDSHKDTVIIDDQERGQSDRSGTTHIIGSSSDSPRLSDGQRL